MRALTGRLSLVLVASLLAGCTYYGVAPGTPPSVSTFDRSWSAARNAMLEEGVRIMQEDRPSGTLSGVRNGIQVIAYVRSQADGSVRVEFRTVGATAVDPQLIERISADYERLMGR